MIGPANTQIIEEDLIQLVIIILPGMDHDVIGVLVQLRENAGEADDLRASAHHSHDFQPCFERGYFMTHAGSTSSATVSGLAGSKSSCVQKRVLRVAAPTFVMLWV